MAQDKRLYGQFFTVANPFETVAFYKWISENQKEFESAIILEPFAGSNNIPRMILDAEILKNSWNCYDIQPNRNKVPQFPIIERDTIEDFPQGYIVCITNPPYLSKNSATRRGLSYPNTAYDDVYKLCLEIMLDNVPYVAAIIPETFITSGLFHDRLKYVVSLTCKMFEDTDCPVCLAMFNREASDDFLIYQMDEKLGNYSELSRGLITPKWNYDWTVNDPNGIVGIKCIDNTREPSISFCRGEEIPSSAIKVSSRSITRVSGPMKGIDLVQFLKKCNSLLEKYRFDTKDVFMASFKGLRTDGKYRRRLDFYTAKQIMSEAYWEVLNEKN